MKPFTLSRDDWSGHLRGRDSFHFRHVDQTLMKIQFVIQNSTVTIPSASYALAPTLAEDMKFEGGNNIDSDGLDRVTFINGREFFLSIGTARRFWNELVTKGFTRMDA